MKTLSTDEKNYLLAAIRDINDFPKPGILFKDITTLLNDKKAFSFLMTHLKERYAPLNLDFIVGIESRGFILGAALAAVLGVGFVPVRKPGKLPYITISQKYSLEYGVDEIEMHIDAFGENKDARVILIDDLIATGGTAIAACDLIKNIGANLLETCFLIDLKALGGNEKLAKTHKIYSILEI